MKDNQKIIKKQLNVLEGFGLISFGLLVGMTSTISSPSLGFNHFNGIGDVFAFIVMILLFGLLGGGPAMAVLYFMYDAKFGGTSGIYQTAWLDGVLDSQKDHPEVKGWLGK